jgi:protein-S-isoprenylcysteine O-methyltransferase Ste14
MRLEAFRWLQLAILIVFAVLISDFRRRRGSEPLLPRAAVTALKLVYPIPFLTYLVVVMQLDAVALRDLLALALTATGTALIARARLDIGRSYTWTGYCQALPVLVSRGVYARVRHPIYEGIWLFMAGGTLTVVARVSLVVHVAAGLSLAYIGVFLTMASARETRFLAGCFGDDFERYRKRVGAVFPSIRPG